MKALALLWCAAVAFALFCAPWPSRADPKPGIRQEGAFNISGETVIRFRDTTHGSNNVCYFVVPRGEREAISCVKETP
jgi:hypothetical protein